jgi:hypothetical protein
LLDLSLECGIARQQQALNLLESGTNATKYHAMLCGDCFYLYNWKTEKIIVSLSINWGFGNSQNRVLD